MMDILSSVVQEGENLSQEVMDAILVNVVEPNKVREEKREEEEREEGERREEREKGGEREGRRRREGSRKKGLSVRGACTLCVYSVYMCVHV